MIKSGYSSVNESISGPLATALKQMDQKQKNRLRQLRPHIEIRGGKSGGGDDCSHLEKGVSQCLSQSCIEWADIPGDRQSTGENDQKIPTDFFDGKSFLKLFA